MFPLQGNRVEEVFLSKGASVTMEQTSQAVNSKMKQKITFNFALCQVRLILFNTNLNTKNNISFNKTVLKML